MPFITQDRRDIIDQGGLHALDDLQPGDRCYVHYKKMVDRWKATPRWKTAHEIYKDMINEGGTESEDDLMAYLLAWQVFFLRWVWPYEQEAIKRNGDIE